MEGAARFTGKSIPFRKDEAAAGSRPTQLEPSAFRSYDELEYVARVCSQCHPHSDLAGPPATTIRERANHFSVVSIREIVRRIEVVDSNMMRPVSKQD